uniref:Uncharacterized protein n=1 Tax=Vespula pensylvanica TaxID=30213 RepID=A0A834KWE1_VESPE|nr:hypothetical protein H0235_013007 [Vespula pensylvanica]
MDLANGDSEGRLTLLAEGQASKLLLTNPLSGSDQGARNSTASPEMEQRAVELAASRFLDGVGSDKCPDTSGGSNAS